MKLAESLAVEQFKTIQAGGPGSGRRPSTGTYMMPAHHLSKKSGTAADLAKLQFNENGMKSGAITTYRKADGGIVHVSGSGSHEGYDRAGNKVGDHGDTAIDTGNGYRSGPDVTVLNHSSHEDGRLTDSANGAVGQNEKGRFYVYK